MQLSCCRTLFSSLRCLVNFCYYPSPTHPCRTGDTRSKYSALVRPPALEHQTQENKEEDAFLLGVEGENAAAPQRKTKGEAFHHQVTETEQAWEGVGRSHWARTRSDPHLETKPSTPVPELATSENLSSPCQLKLLLLSFREEASLQSARNPCSPGSQRRWIHVVLAHQRNS